MSSPLNSAYAHIEVNVESPFLNSVRRTIRTLHYSIRTEQAYLSWIRQYLLFHNKRHPSGMGVAEVGKFLSYLANERHVSAATQNQALNALNFLYKKVLGLPLGDLQGVGVQSVRNACRWCSRKGRSISCLTTCPALAC